MSSRRAFLSTTLRAAGGFALAPTLIRRQSARPAIPYGTSSGDVTRDRAIIWSRTDRPARMLVEWSTTESFQNVRRVRGPQTTDAAGYTARVDVDRDPSRPADFLSRAVRRSHRLAQSQYSCRLGLFCRRRGTPRDVTFAWSADTVGQGWGINMAWGGLRMYETMRLARPDFFIHTGDTIYADSPVPAEIRLPDGTMWRNVVTAEKSKVAETLDEFRGNHTYNLLDDNVRRFNPEIPQLVAVGRPRGEEQLVPGHEPRRRRSLHTEELARAGGKRATRVSRILADSPVAGRRAADLPLVLVRSASRGVRDRPAHLSRPEHGEPAKRARRRNGSRRRAAARVAEARAALLYGGLESDRQRSAHRPGRARRRHGVRSDCQWRRGPSPWPRARDRRSPALHAAASGFGT